MRTFLTAAVIAAFAATGAVAQSNSGTTDPSMTSTSTGTPPATGKRDKAKRDQRGQTVTDQATDTPSTTDMQAPVDPATEPTPAPDATPQDPTMPPDASAPAPTVPPRG